MSWLERLEGEHSKNSSTSANRTESRFLSSEIVCDVLEDVNSVFGVVSALHFSIVSWNPGEVSWLMTT